MLSDILATIIAFISVILLLSIVVTSLVQVSQAFLRLRGRNLMKGLAALLVNARMAEKNAEDPTPAEKKQARIDATKIMNAPNVALTNRVEKPDRWARYWLAGPQVSWIDPDDLAGAVKLAKVKTGGKSKKKLAEDFRKSEMHMKKRFLRITRGWSVAWAMVVAFAFQISAPALFNELASDSERRDLIVADAENLLTYHTESVANVDFNLAAPRALEMLAKRHVEHRELIEQASGVGTTHSFVVQELELALEDVPERDTLVAEYRELIREVTESMTAQTSENLQYSVSQLRQYKIEFWPRGKVYYWNDVESVPRMGNVIGVLITAILLSFGGSFWFEQLRNVLALRDTLAGKGRKQDQEKAGKEQPAAAVTVVASGDVGIATPAAGAVATGATREETESPPKT